MTGPTHLLTSAFIYKYGGFKTPYLFLLAFLSHFLLDAIPHYELSIEWNLALGACAGVFLLERARTRGDYKIIIAAVLGGLPDGNWMLKVSPFLSGIHNFFHFKKIFPVPVFFLLFEAVFAFSCAYLIVCNRMGDSGYKKILRK